MREGSTCQKYRQSVNDLASTGRPRNSVLCRVMVSRGFRDHFSCRAVTNRGHLFAATFVMQIARGGALPEWTFLWRKKSPQNSQKWPDINQANYRTESTVRHMNCSTLNLWQKDVADLPLSRFAASPENVSWPIAIVELRIGLVSTFLLHTSPPSSHVIQLAS